MFVYCSIGYGSLGCTVSSTGYVSMVYSSVMAKEEEGSTKRLADT